MCNGWAVGVSMYWWQWQIAILSPCVFCPSKFLIWKPHPVPYRPRTQFWLEKKISTSDEAFSQTDVKTNVYKRMLSSRLPWQLDLFSSQTKTFVSEITGRIRAWKQADSCSEDLPLAIQIGQCLLLVGFNGKFAFFTVGRCTKASKPFHALEHLFLLFRGFSAFWPAGFSTSSRPIVIFRLITFSFGSSWPFLFLFSSLSSLFVFQGNHDERSALATQCETTCATRLSYHGICAILRAIGTICVIRKRPIFFSLNFRTAYALVLKCGTVNSQLPFLQYGASNFWYLFYLFLSL